MESKDIVLEPMLAAQKQFENGLRAGREISRLAHAALAQAYDMAKKDEITRLPTPLMCAIENVLRLREESVASRPL